MAKKDRKDRDESISRYITSSLDNVKRFIDRAADEVAKADVVGANRRLVDHLIDGTKDTIEQVADSAGKGEPMSAIRGLAVGILDTTRHAVRVASEEVSRINLVETGANVTAEGLDMLRRQVDIVFDVTENIGEAMDDAVSSVNERLGNMGDTVSERINKVGDMMPNFNMGFGEPQKRPGVITRVEIESDKGVVNAEGGGERGEGRGKHK